MQDISFSSSQETMAKRGGVECKKILRMWWTRSYGMGGGVVAK